jgi:uncharacterized protein HemY
MLSVPHDIISAQQKSVALVFLSGIFVFLGMMITFYHGNSVVCREVSRQNRRSLWPLIAVLINLTACIVFIYFVFREDELYLW